MLDTQVHFLHGHGRPPWPPEDVPPLAGPVPPGSGQGSTQSVCTAAYGRPYGAATHCAPVPITLS
jgi:hypothetical protein